MLGALSAALAAAAFLAPSAAGATKTCSEPGVKWTRATAAEVGMDAGKLKEAVDFAMSDNALAFRVYRHGCLVAENASAPEGTSLQTQSWSMAKGVSSVAFGRAWTLGLISPDDPVGSLYPEADRAHGKIRLRDLLSMAAGNSQAFFHDFNIGMPDRVRDGLTIPLVHKPGTYFNYWQTGPPLVDEAIKRAAGEDFQAFFQRELLSAIGIKPGSWSWGRDLKGHTQGFFDLRMRPDDYARFGDLMRRDGVWRGKRLLSRRYMRNAVTPTSAYGCYGWFLWLHASRQCDGRSGEGNVKGWDPKLFEFNGLNQQLVTVFPATDIVMVRVGAGPGRTRALYEHTLRAVTDQPVPMPTIAPDPNSPPFRQTPSKDDGTNGLSPPPLPAAGPPRARAVQLESTSTRSDAKGRVTVVLHCPPRLPATQSSCTGRAALARALAPRGFDIAAGASTPLRFKLTKSALRRLKRSRRATLTLAATTRAANATGTVARDTVRVAAPKPTARQSRTR